MTDSGIVERLRRIDNYQQKISEAISDIEQSDHPRAAEIANALYEQCWFPASAEHVVLGFLNPGRWALRVLRSGHGGIVPRVAARKAGLEVTS